MADIVFSALLDVGIFVILALSLNIINGYTGMLSLGHAGFFAVGAYAASLTMNALAPEGAALADYLYSAPYWGATLLSVGAAMGAAGLAGLLVGVPCLRLAGDYLAIATLAFGEIVRIFFESFRPDLLGGPRGLTLTADKMHSHWGFCVVLAAALGVALFARNLKRSATGRALFAVRENEIAAQVMGMNTAFLKVEAFVLGSALAGLAGALFSVTRYLIAPINFDLMATIMILLMIVLGGLGSVSGAILGALILGVFDRALRFLPELYAWLFGAFSESARAPQWLDKAKENPQIFYALLLIVLIRLRPQGLLGMHELLEMRRARKREGLEAMQR